MPTFVADEIVTAAKLNAGTARDWTTWAPSYANLTVGSGTVVARYVQVGKLVVCYWTFTYGSGSAVGTVPTISLPVTASSSYVTTSNSQTSLGTAAVTDAGVTVYPGYVSLASTTTVTVSVVATAAAFGTRSLLSATSPITFGSGDAIHFEATYEAA